MLLEDLVEGALAAAQRPHPVVRVAVAVERDLHAAETVGRQAIDDLRRQQQAVGDDVENISTPRASQACHMRSDR